MMRNRGSKLWWVLGLCAALCVCTGVMIAAKGEGGPDRVRAYADATPPNTIPQQLPQVPKRPALETPRVTQVLQFDDGTCESGLGALSVVTSYSEFDVPTQCFMGGLDIIQLTTRMNTFTANAFAYAQSGGAPPVGNFNLIGIPPIVGVGMCPPPTQPGLTTRSIGPGAAVITGTANFWAGIFNNGFAGRDANGPPAGRIWINCATCGMTQYGPATLSPLGLGGNWMIRITVEDQNCVPVELMEFGAS